VGSAISLTNKDLGAVIAREARVEEGGTADMAAERWSECLDLVVDDGDTDEEEGKEAADRDAISDAWALSVSLEKEEAMDDAKLDAAEATSPLLDAAADDEDEEEVADGDDGVDGVCSFVVGDVLAVVDHTGFCFCCC
jgi:polyhydroxyalkanoate synthesis regulator phasin